MIMPYRSSVPLFWRMKKSKYGLIGTRCVTCNYLYFPPRPLCPKCRSKGKIEDFQFSGEGKIISFTIIRVPPEGFEKYTPYAVGMIKMKEGPLLEGQIVGDVNSVDIGQSVKTVFRRIYEDNSDGLIHYGLKWKIVS